MKRLLSLILVVLITLSMQIAVFATDTEVCSSFNSSQQAEEVYFYGNENNVNTRDSIGVAVQPEMEIAVKKYLLKSQWRAESQARLKDGLFYDVTWDLRLNVQLYRDYSLLETSENTIKQTNYIDHVTRWYTGTNSDQFGARAHFDATDDAGVTVGQMNISCGKV